MVASINQQALPVIFKVIEDAENSLMQLLGCKVNLKIELGSLHVEYNEAQSLMVQNAVCSYFKISFARIISKSRKRDIVIPRQICIYLLRETTSMSLKDIGELMGKLHHTTCLHSISEVENAIDSNYDKIVLPLREIQMRLRYEVETKQTGV